MQHFDEIISRHERIGFQFSGGKDSLASLYLLRPHLDRMTVYWLNTGDCFPETVALIDSVRSWVPSFVEIDGQQDRVIEEFGIPSDIVPASATMFGRLVGHDQPLIQDRYSCCFRVVMQPLHERMLADGVTLIIRGQRKDDGLKGPLRSGDVQDGIEYLFPVEAWTQEQVLAYIKEQGAPVLPFYETMSLTPGCMTCSAWWEDGRAAYLKERHPKEYKLYQERLNAISCASAEAIANFNIEIAG